MNQIDESRWINDSHGMELKPDENLGQRKNENGIHFLGIYYAIKKVKKIFTEKDVITFSEIVQRLRTYGKDGQINGLYDRGAHESDITHKWYVEPAKRRTISHDNLSATSCFAADHNLPYAKHIAEMAVKSFMRFDNRYPDDMGWRNLQVQPRDWFTWLFNGGGWYRVCSYMLFPLYFIAAMEDILMPMKCRPVWYERLWAKITGKDIGPKRCFVDTSGQWLWNIIQKVTGRILERTGLKRWLINISMNQIYIR